MKTRKLGNGNLEVSALGLGCMRMSFGDTPTDKQEMIALLTPQIPVRRIGQPAEVGHLIAFLASDMAGYINGACIPLDGGGSLNTMTLGSTKDLRSMMSVE